MTTTNPDVADTLYQTASVSPTNGRAVYVAVESARTDGTMPPLPSVTGCGLSWTPVTDVPYDDGTSVGPAGPVTVALLASDKSGANQVSYTLGPFTPTPGTTLGLVVAAVDDAGHIPSVVAVTDTTGRVYDIITPGGIVNQTQTDEYKLLFFVAATGNIGSATTLTVTFSEQITGVNLVLLEFTGADEGTPVPIGQCVHASITTAAKPDISLPLPPGPDSMVIAAVGVRRNPANWTPEAGWTEHYDDANSNPTNGLEVATKLGDQRFTATGTSLAHWLLIAEIQTASTPGASANRRRLSVFKGTGTPSTGPVFIGFSNVQSHCNWHVIESDGTDNPKVVFDNQISSTGITRSFTPVQPTATVLTFLARSGPNPWTASGATQISQSNNAATPSVTLAEYTTATGATVIGGTGTDVQNVGIIQIELRVLAAPTQTNQAVARSVTMAAAIATIKRSASSFTKGVAATTQIAADIQVVPRFTPKKAIALTLTTSAVLVATKRTPVHANQAVARPVNMGADLAPVKRLAPAFVSGGPGAGVNYRVVLATRGAEALGTPIISDVFTTAGVPFNDQFVGRWSRVLNAAGSFEFTLPIDACTPDVYAPGEREVHVYRNKGGVEQLAWAGTLYVADVRQPWVRFLAMGWYEALRHREMGDDFFQKNAEQLDIAWDLIDYTQQQPDGALGITRGTSAGSGVNRTVESCAEARGNIADLIEDLAGGDNGFDFEVTPDKVWETWTPERGVDHTIDVVLDASTDIVDFAYTIDATTVENEVAGIGSQGNCEPIHYVKRTDDASRARYGLMQGTVNRSDLKDRDLISSLASEELALRSVARRQPTVQLTQVLGGKSIFAGDFDLGDSISIAAAWGYATFTDQFRVLGYLVSFDRLGNEFVELTVDATS